MGSENSKGSNSKSSKYREIEERFNNISSSKHYLIKNDLQKVWKTEIAEVLYFLLENYLFQGGVDKIKFNIFLNIYQTLCEGSAEEKSVMICKLISQSENANNVAKSELHKFISSIIESIIIISKNSKLKNLASWITRNCPSGENEYNKLSQYYLSQFDKEINAFTSQDIRQILQNFDIFVCSVFGYLFKPDVIEQLSSFFPLWVYNHIDRSKTLDQLSILNETLLLFLNMELPVDYQLEWRLLYSTNIHGESFSKLSSEIINKGASIIIVKDKDDHIFGGFAPENWTLNPNFVGSSSSFLFTISPSMNIFSASNFNEHYQYMNAGQQTIPNGLGMGGQFNYFGLWIDSEFGKGHSSPSCSTYKNYTMLSGKKDFEISHLEVWAVGPPPATAEELGERSILDSNAETKAMLEMMGKKQYSEGLREIKQDLE